MIIFRNEGLINLDAITTMGVSVKKPGSFGQFGTGLKFAIATILRGGGKVSIWRGNKQHNISTISKTIRGEAFNIITFNDEQIGVTTNLGLNWEPWMVLRELGCNALDEGGSFYHDELGAEGLNKEKGYTTITVEWDELDEAYKRRKKIFLEGQPLWQSDKLRILSGPSKFIYYRGVRVFELNKPTLLTYDFLKEQSLTEDRTLNGTWSTDRIITNEILKIEDKTIAAQVISCGENYHEDGLDFEVCDFGVEPSRTFLDASIGAREAKKPLNQSARKILLRNSRKAVASMETTTEFQDDNERSFGHALSQLEDIGIGFGEDQKFITVDEMPAPEILSILEEGRIYILRKLLTDHPRKIASELLARWVDINVQGYGQDNVVDLFKPIILDACTSLPEKE